MADIKCKKCLKSFDGNNKENMVTRGAAAAAGGGGGAWIGSQLGIVGGPIGGINGMWVGAAVGAITGFCAADQFRRCPHCGKIFKT